MLENQPLPKAIEDRPDAIQYLNKKLENSLTKALEEEEEKKKK